MTPLTTVLPPRVHLMLLVALVLVALAALFALVGRHDFEQLRSFHVIADVSQTAASPASPTPLSANLPQVTRIEGWYKDGKVRWDLAYSGPNAPTRPSIRMTDGTTTYYYDATQDTYFEEPLLTRSSLGFFSGIGPLPQFSIDDLMRKARSSSSFVSQSTQDWTYLGRKVVVVTQNSREEVGGLAIDLQLTYAIDPQYMLALTYKGRSDYGSSSFAATEVQYNVPIPDTKFVFQPPATAKQIDPPASSPANLTRMSSNVPDPPPGFFKPAQTPRAYRLNQRQVLSPNENQPPKFELGYVTDGVPVVAFLDISQTPSSADIPRDLLSDDVVGINAAQGFFTTIGGSTRLTWLRGDVLITLEANQLSRDQMLSVARSMR